MLNCAGRLADDPAGFARRIAGLLGLDHHRVLLRLFAPVRPGIPRLAAAG